LRLLLALDALDQIIEALLTTKDCRVLSHRNESRCNAREVAPVLESGFVINLTLRQSELSRDLHKGEPLALGDLIGVQVNLISGDVGRPIHRHSLDDGLAHARFPLFFNCIVYVGPDFGRPDFVST
jgi:hypothetical protein